MQMRVLLGSWGIHERAHESRAPSQGCESVKHRARREGIPYTKSQETGRHTCLLQHFPVVRFW